MAVHVDITRVDRPEELWTHPEGHPHREMAPLTKWLGIILCVHLGMSEITAATEQEVYARLRMLQGLGALVVNGEDDYLFTFADVRRHRGMRVNARREAPTTFTARIRRIALDQAADAARDLDRAEEVANGPTEMEWAAG